MIFSVNERGLRVKNIHGHLYTVLCSYEVTHIGAHLSVP